MLRRAMGLMILIAGLGAMLVIGCGIFSSGAFSLGLLVLIVGLGLLAIGVALLGPPTPRAPE